MEEGGGGEKKGVEGKHREHYIGRDAATRKYSFAVIAADEGLPLGGHGGHGGHDGFERGWAWVRGAVRRRRRAGREG